MNKREVHMSLLDCIISIPNHLKDIVDNYDGIKKELEDHFKDQKIEKIVFVGSGTSLNASKVTRYFAKDECGFDVRCFYPNDFVNYTNYEDPCTLYVFVSQGGATKLVYEALENNKSLDSKFIRTKELIINKTTRSYLKHNTSNASTKDGKKSGCVLFNEMHAYEDYKNIGVFTSGFGKKRHSRIFIITTNGYVRGGPLDDYESTCFDILKTGDNELGYFPFICRIKNEEEHLCTYFLILQCLCLLPSLSLPIHLQ